MQRNPDVTFSQHQLAYLADLFPAQTLGPNTSQPHMNHYFGQQSVIDAVRRKTRGAPKSDIPTPQ